MITIQLQTQVSLETLLNSLKQLNSSELAQVASQTALLRAQQNSSHLGEIESELMTKIQSTAVPLQTQRRLHDLDAKSQRSGLSKVEQQELMQLVDEVEQLNANRVSLLLELANLRGISLHQIMTDLQIEPLSFE